MTRTGRTALRAVERDGDPATQTPNDHVVLVFPVRRHAHYAGRMAGVRPALSRCFFVFLRSLRSLVVNPVTSGGWIGLL